MTTTESTLLLLNLRFDNLSGPPWQNTGIATIWQSTGTIQDCQVTLKICVEDISTIFRAFRISRYISSIHGALWQSFLTTSVTSTKMGKVYDFASSTKCSFHSSPIAPVQILHSLLLRPDPYLSDGLPEAHWDPLLKSHSDKNVWHPLQGPNQGLQESWKLQTVVCCRDAYPSRADWAFIFAECSHIKATAGLILQFLSIPKHTCQLLPRG